MSSSEPRPRGGARRPRRAVRLGTERTAVPGTSADERPDGWGDEPDDARGAGPGRRGRTPNDDRLLRDVPPHYGRD